MSALYRTTDPDTSRQAAQSIRDITATQTIVYATLKRTGPSTDEQILDALRAIGVNISDSGARTRRKELCQRGLVIDSGERGVTASGRSTVIWKAVTA